MFADLPGLKPSLKMDGSNGIGNLKKKNVLMSLNRFLPWKYRSHNRRMAWSMQCQGKWRSHPVWPLPVCRVEGQARHTTEAQCPVRFYFAATNKINYFALIMLNAKYIKIWIKPVRSLPPMSLSWYNFNQSLKNVYWSFINYWKL